MSTTNQNQTEAATIGGIIHALTNLQDVCIAASSDHTDALALAIDVLAKVPHETRVDRIASLDPMLTCECCGKSDCCRLLYAMELTAVLTCRDITVSWTGPSSAIFEADAKEEQGLDRLEFFIGEDVPAESAMPEPDRVISEDDVRSGDPREIVLTPDEFWLTGIFETALKCGEIHIGVLGIGKSGNRIFELNGPVPVVGGNCARRGAKVS